jgi:thioredoxin reductase
MASVDTLYEVIVIGGGPAGLSGALVLGRCGRRVVVCDDHRPRNSVSKAMHGFLGRDGTPPGEFLKVCRDQLRRYPHVELRDAEAIDVGRSPGGFWVKLRTGELLRSKKLLLTTGLVDELPQIEGLPERWGRSVYPCPFCDAWEYYRKPMAVMGCGFRSSCEFGLEMLTWSSDVVVLTHGAEVDDPQLLERTQKMGIEVATQPIARLVGEYPALDYIELVDGRRFEANAFFILTEQRQRTSFAEKLGCSLVPQDRTVKTDDLQHTRARGVYAAGNASVGLQAAILAAAEGFKAAYAINDELVEDLVTERLGSAARPTQTLADRREGA